MAQAAAEWNKKKCWLDTDEDDDGRGPSVSQGEEARAWVVRGWCVVDGAAEELKLCAVACERECRPARLSLFIYPPPSLQTAAACSHAK